MVEEETVPDVAHPAPGWSCRYNSQRATTRPSLYHQCSRLFHKTPLNPSVLPKTVPQQFRRTRRFISSSLVQPDISQTTKRASNYEHIWLEIQPKRWSTYRDYICSVPIRCATHITPNAITEVITSFEHAVPWQGTARSAVRLPTIRIQHDAPPPRTFLVDEAQSSLVDGFWHERGAVSSRWGVRPVYMTLPGWFDASVHLCWVPIEASILFILFMKYTNSCIKTTDNSKV